MRVAYIGMGVVAFCLALLAGDLFFIVVTGFFLIASLASAAIAWRLERRDAP